MLQHEPERADDDNDDDYDEAPKATDASVRKQSLSEKAKEGQEEVFSEQEEEEEEIEEQEEVIEQEDDEEEEEWDVVEFEEGDEKGEVEKKKRERRDSKTKGQKKKRKHVKEKKKTSLQNYLWDENDNGKWICKLKAICGSDGVHNKFHQFNMKRHWMTKHAKSFAAVERASEEGSDVKAVVTTLVNCCVSSSRRVSNYFTSKPHHLASSTSNTSGHIVSGRVRKEVDLLRFMICSRTALNSLKSKEFAALQESWGVTLDGESTIESLIPVMFDTAISMGGGVIG